MSSVGKSITSPTWKATLPVQGASKSFLAGRKPEHQRALEEAVAVATYRHLPVPKLAETLRDYGVKAHLATGVGAEILRNPAVAKMLENQTHFGGKSELQRRFEEIGSTSLIGSTPATRKAMEEALTGYTGRSPLAALSRINPRAREGLLGMGTFGDATARRLAEADLSAQLADTLLPKTRHLAAETFSGLDFFSRTGHRPEFTKPAFPDAPAGLGELLAGVTLNGKWDKLSAAFVSAGLAPSLDALALGTVKPSGRFLLDAAPETLPTPEVLPPLGQGDQLTTSPRNDEDLAPVVAGRNAARDRRMVLTLLEEAELEEEREHLEALEERLRAGHAPARNHAAVSARQLLLGVADHCFPARSAPHRCRLGCPQCPHPLGSQEVMNRIIAFVEERLAGKLDPQEFKIFLAQASYVYRWGGRGTHQNLSAPEAVTAFVRLLEVLAMVARAYGISQPQGLPV